MEISTEHEMILPGVSAWGAVRGASGYMETSTEHKMILPGGSACVVGCGVGGLLATWRLAQNTR